MRDQFGEDVVHECHSRLISDLQLFLQNRSVPLASIVYEAASLDGLLSESDLELLAPEHSALSPVCRDQQGRWREVLDDLGESLSIDVEDGLRIFDHPEAISGRDPAWFVAIAALAIDGGLWSEFAEKETLLLADGRIVRCPTRNGPSVLTKSDHPESLASRLGLALPLHHEYFSDTADAKKVIAKLSEIKSLRESCDEPIEALRLLARTSEPIEHPVRLEE